MAGKKLLRKRHAWVDLPRNQVWWEATRFQLYRRVVVEELLIRVSVRHVSIQCVNHIGRSKLGSLVECFAKDSHAFLRIRHLNVDVVVKALFKIFAIRIAIHFERKVVVIGCQFSNCANVEFT